jgi:predicted ATPase/DNA-binding SARP family transcriptional activator
LITPFMSGLAIRSFGELTLTLDDVALDERIIPLKARALLLYICRQHKEQPREKLASLLWTEFSTERAAHNLRMTLSRLREHLAPYVEITRTEVDAHVWLDANVFEDNLDALRDSLNGIESFTSTTRNQLITTVNLYRDDFLGNLVLPDAAAFHEWADTQREVLRQRFLSAADRLIQVYMEETQYVDGKALAHRLLALDPLREASQQALIRLYALDGDRTAALQQFERFQTLLWDELGVEPEDETIALYEQIAAGELETIPQRSTTLTIPRKTPNNLPGEVSPFYGRDSEIAFLCDRLLTARCVTVIGTGGIGKTRLALRAARTMLDPFPDGVYWVELARLVTAQAVPDAIRVALELPDNGTDTVAVQLAAYLRDKKLLLVLDNFEHVLDAADFVNDLLYTAPTITVLSTSREALNLYGEHRYNLPQLTPADAAHLFTQRARAVNPALTVDHPALLETLCLRLDYLPLALELAASGARTQTLDQIAAQLDVARLSTTLRGLPARQRTLFNTIEWSYERLTPEEKMLYRRLAYFIGSWTEQDADAVCGNAAYLDALVERSLVRREHTTPARYTMLETIRQHARMKLAEHGEDEAMRHAYLRYYTSVAEEGNLKLHGTLRARWMTLLRAAVPNLHAALSIAVDIGDWETECRLVSALALFWHYQGYHREERLFAEHALRHRSMLPPHLLAGLLAALGHAHHVAAEYTAAGVYHDEARELYSQLGDHWNEAFILHCEASRDPDMNSAFTRMSKARALIENSDDVFLYTALSAYLGFCFVMKGDLVQAEQMTHEGLARTTHTADSQSYHLYVVTAIAQREQGHLQNAERLFDYVHTISASDHDFYVTSMLPDEAMNYLLMGRVSEAEACYRQGLLVIENTKTLFFTGDFYLLGGIAAYEAGSTAESWQRCELGLAAMKKTPQVYHDIYNRAPFFAALVWQIAAEGQPEAAAHLRDLLLGALKSAEMPATFSHRFYLERAAPLLENLPISPVKGATLEDVMTYAAECVALFQH